MLSEFETAATFSPDALFERSYEILNRSYLPQISSAAVEVQSSEYSEYRFCRIERLAYDVECVSGNLFLRDVFCALA